MGRLQGQFVEVEDVNINVARAFIDGFLPAHVRLDFLRSIEEFEGEIFGLRLDYHVEKIGLIEHVGGGGFDDRAAACCLDLFDAEAFDGFVEESLAVAEVGAES